MKNMKDNEKSEGVNNRELVNKLTNEFMEKHKLFKDTQGQPWIAINGSGSEVMNLKDKKFRFWVMKQAKEFLGEFPNTHVAEEVAGRLISVALFSDESKPLEVRIARKDNDEGMPEELWYDLRDKQGLAVHITKDGYKIEKPPIIFRRYDHQHEQVKPEAGTGGRLDDIYKIINLTKRDDRVVFTVFLISCFVASFPKPILLITGTNGSGKSTPCRILHRLIDPSAMEDGTALVKDTNELVRQANKLCLLHFDNVDGREISNELSDNLCRITTGQALMRRTLFENDEDTIFEVKRPIIMNGIGRLVEKEDILDRSIIISMQRIPEDERKPENSIYAEFKKMKPYLLHEIFTALSKAIAIYPNIRLKSSHRMADFEVLGYAICEALDGYSGQEWLEIYDRVVKRQVENALESSATAQIAKFLVDRSEYHIWEGTASSMLNFEFSEGDNYTLTDNDRNIIKAIKENPTFPKNASALGAQLNRAESTLRSLGIIIEHSKGDRANYKNGMRWITLKDYGWVKGDNTLSEKVF